MRYAVSRLNEYMREMAYRVYVTDYLQMLSGSNKRYYDLIDPTPPDERTSEEIVDSIWSKIEAGQ
jgi:hypothetical protein